LPPERVGQEVIRAAERRFRSSRFIGLNPVLNT